MQPQLSAPEHHHGERPPPLERQLYKLHELLPPLPHECRQFRQGHLRQRTVLFRQTPIACSQYRRDQKTENGTERNGTEPNGKELNRKERNETKLKGTKPQEKEPKEKEQNPKERNKTQRNGIKPKGTKQNGKE